MASIPPQSSQLPGIGFEAVRPTPEAPLRTDIALFIGSCERGPVGAPTRVEGWRAFVAIFGDLQADMVMPHAVRSYFDNGGRVAHILRLAPGAWVASAKWDLLADGGFAPAAAVHQRYHVTAKYPGVWGNALSVEPIFRRGDGEPDSFEFVIRSNGEVIERLGAVRVDAVEEDVGERSAFVSIKPDDTSPVIAPSAATGPRRREWDAIRPVSGSAGTTPTRDNYVQAIEQAMRVPEAALIAMPDLHSHCTEQDAAEVILAAARSCDIELDRMVVADLPEYVELTQQAQAWLARFANDPAVARAAAFYHPWIAMRDPIGTLKAPLRTMPPSGHVAGLISRLDRIKGAHVTPANDSLSDAADLTRRPGDTVQGQLNSLGINALRCQSGRGLVVWGGRTPNIAPGGQQFVAHRRLVHRLVRALRRVAEPLVFDPNDHMLALTLSRTATTLLMESFHAGVLKGVTPQEAFQIEVGPDVNDPITRDRGQLICLISIAPAVPMEFIQIRVGLNPAGEIEMVEV